MDPDVDYEVEKILGKRIENGSLQYFIKWKGYDESWNTWEPDDNLECPDRVAEYEAEQESEWSSSQENHPKMNVKKKRSIAEIEPEENGNGPPPSRFNSKVPDPNKSTKAKSPAAERPNERISKPKFSETLPELIEETGVIQEAVMLEDGLHFLVREGSDNPQLVPFLKMREVYPQRLISHLEQHIKFLDDKTTANFNITKL